MENTIKAEERVIAASQSFKEREYWMKKLSGQMVKTFIPPDNEKRKIPDSPSSREIHQLTINGAHFAGLMKLSNTSDPRLFMILVTTWNILLSKYTSSQDIIVGTTIPRQEAEGEFINTVLALRNQWSHETTFKELLMQVRQTIIEANENQNYPIETLIYDLKLPEDNRFPLFDTAVLLENIHDKKYLRGINIGIIFSFQRNDESLQGMIDYDASLYHKSTLERIGAHFRQLLTEVLDNIDVEVRNVNIIPEEERLQLLSQWNNTGSPYPKNKLLHQLFEEQVQRTPENIALVFENQQVKYKHLNEKANQLAHILRNKGIKGDQAVGLMADISIEMVIGIIGILKAGAAYIPIDADYPPDRVAYMLKDCHVNQLLTQTPYIEKINFASQVIDLNDEALFSGDGTNPGIINQSNNLAYIIYTSGSTGKPKGVMIRHHNIVNQIYGLQQQYCFDSSYHHILLAAFTFDPSVQQIFLPLYSGGVLYLISKASKYNAEVLLEFLARNKIDVLNTVPSLMDVLLNMDILSGQLEEKKPMDFKYIILAGELFSMALYRKLTERFSAGKIINIYGPTEAAINTTQYICEAEEVRDTLPIGKPLMNYQVYILDKHLKLVPTMVVGELCIAGDGLARGYLNQPELTAEKFERVAINHSSNDRLYRTGDLARWLQDGNIEFAGRIDQQLKIRGFRVEPEEIENLLLKYNGIREAAVIAKKDKEGNKYLSAYLTTDMIDNDRDIVERFPELWPSAGEYIIWDEALYYTMTNDEIKNKGYKTAINQLVKDKVVVDLGTGKDAVLARFCAEAGAKKIYAIEILNEFAQEAKATISELHLEEKIILINGDLTQLELPEKVDICISNLFGNIGSAEGAITLHNHAQRFLKENGMVIPQRVVTKIAAVHLPNLIHEKPVFSTVALGYQEKIFEKFGGPFDLRICLKNFPKENKLSSTDIFEDLNLLEMTAPEEHRQLKLVIEQGHSRMDGFILWLNIHPTKDQVIDIFEDKLTGWAPLYIPVFYPGVEVMAGDEIIIETARYLSEHCNYPGYRINGTLKRQQGKNIDFEYDLPYDEKAYKKNDFYKKLFENNQTVPGNKKQDELIDLNQLRKYLEKRLPDYMIPSSFITLDKLPLTSHGKLDRKALEDLETEVMLEDDYVEPQTPTQEKLRELWTEHLGLNRIGIKDNYFNIGGDSIKSIRLISIINKKLDRDLKIVDLYVNNTIEKLAEFIDQKEIPEETFKESDEILKVSLEIEDFKNRIMKRK